MDLFKQQGAKFSKCGRYRYSLWRIWDDTQPMVAFIGLNPSTANATEDDPTIRRVKSFAHRWGFGGVYMLNLFAWVTPYPWELQQCPDPLGENDQYLEQYAAQCDRMVFAWGSFPEATDRARVVAGKFPGAYALVINQDGSPRHPLYVRGDVEPIKFVPCATT